MRRVIAATLTAVALSALSMSAALAQQCVPYARELSGISIRGDAWTWWASAEGAYERGARPQKGAVLVFKKHGSMRHGHVSVVSRIVGKREILVDHSNWAPVRASDRGKVGRNVRVLDISPRNDWTQVRVWHDPSGDFGVRVYPAYGFIYSTPGKAKDVKSARVASPVAAAAAADARHVHGGISTVGKKPRVSKPVQHVALTTPVPAEIVKPDRPAESPQAVAQSVVQQMAASDPAPTPDVAATNDSGAVWAGDREAAARAGSGRY